MGTGGEPWHKGWSAREILYKKIKKTCQNKSITHTCDFSEESEDTRTLKDSVIPEVLTYRTYRNRGLSYAQNAALGIGCPSPCATPSSEGAVIPKNFGAYLYHQ